MKKSMQQIASKLRARTVRHTVNRSKFRRRLVILLTVGLVGIALFVLWFAPDTAANADQGLNAFLAQANAPNDVREAYRFAAIHPDVLKAVPCYCGCVSHGHKDNYSCFIKPNGEFDQHGLNCGTCVQIALKAKRSYQEGASLPEIRQQVDDAYQTLPDMKPTPTPLPSKGQSLHGSLTSTIRQKWRTNRLAGT
jgi:hypothetical protein